MPASGFIVYNSAMATRKLPTTDADSPWKEALDHFLPRFLEFFFPDIFKAIDWKRGYQALDKEFQQIVRGAASGRVLADKLYKVWRNNGAETWLLIHVEIQGQAERIFPRRMFDYYVRAFQLYNRPVVSLAVLCDDQRDWRPHQFSQELLGCRLSLEFPMVKLLDYDDLPALEEHDNPFAQVVLAHLKARQTRHDPTDRYAWKVRLVRGLYDRGWTAHDVRQLCRLLDWIMALPSELETQFRSMLYRYEQEKHMPYVTSMERLAKEEGREEGRQEGRQEGVEEGIAQGLRLGLLQGLKAALERGFGPAGLALMPRIESLKNVEKLQRLTDAIPHATSLNQFKKLLR